MNAAITSPTTGSSRSAWPTPAPAGRAGAPGGVRRAAQARRVEIVGILAELDEAATHEADAGFPDERLERQQARILQRVEHDGRPGRADRLPGAAIDRHVH